MTTRAAIDSDRSLRVLHPIHRGRPVMRGERRERPVGIGQDANAAFDADQNRDSAAGAAIGGRLRYIENSGGIFQEPAHLSLIG